MEMQKPQIVLTVILHTKWKKEQILLQQFLKLMFQKLVQNVIVQLQKNTHKVFTEPLLLNGNTDAPVCTNCHGEHNILKHNDPDSPVSARNVSKQVCTPCHSSVKLANKYGLSPNRPETFKDSFHGLAIEGGSTTVANCASCHGAHSIKPASDPTSSVYKGNLAETCGKCHPGCKSKFYSW